MDSVVVDTDVVSFLFKGDTRAQLYRPELHGRRLVISFQTVAELDRWAIERNWTQARKTKMDQHLRNFVVYPYDRALSLRWADLNASLKAKGRSISAGDAWIASTALLVGIPLVTHNYSHFQHIDGLTVISHAPKANAKLPTK